MYKVLIAFADGENGIAWPPERGGHFYAVGDSYPVAGFKPSEAHIAYLLGNENKLGRPLVEKKPEENPSQGADLAKLKKAELEALAEKEGVDIKDAKTKDDIIAALAKAQQNKEGGTDGSATEQTETPPEPDGQQ